jgi:hypothetical protein
MAQTFTTTELLVQIREMARLPDDEPDATDTILLRKATEILQSVYAPAVRKVREDYYVATSRIALASGRASYPIPRRAVTASVRRVRLLDSAGRELRMTQVPYESLLTSQTGLRPDFYSLADDRVMVSPTPIAGSTSYRLELVFEYRPSMLVPVDEDELSVVVASNYNNPTADTHTVYALADVFQDADLIDIVRKDAPFSSPVIDATINARGVTVSGYALDLTSYSGLQDQNLGLVVGDWVCPAGETPVPQIPAELHPILAKHTAAAWLAPIDTQTSAELKDAADLELKDALAAMSPRKLGKQMKMRPTAGGIRTRGIRRSGGTFNDWEP